jgi:GDP-L-fucose synthase
MIQTNIINSSYQAGVKNLLFLGSSCIYPRDCPQPIKEEYLLTGKLEHTNEPYAIAKIAGIKQCESYNSQYGTSYISVMPTNLYGPNDNFDLESSHVIPALIRKFHAAVINNQDRVEVWGTGSPKREFLHVDDMASACVYLMENKWSSKEINPLYNVGTGKDLTIMELAYLIKDISGFQGDIVFDTTKPDGTPRKVLDTSLITKTGWKPQLSLEEGLKDTYHWYVENKAD